MPSRTASAWITTVSPWTECAIGTGVQSGSGGIGSPGRNTGIGSPQ